MPRYAKRYPDSQAPGDAVQQAMANLGKALGLSEVNDMVERAQAHCGRALAEAGAETISLKRERLLRQQAACMEQVIARLRAVL